MIVSRPANHFLPFVIAGMFLCMASCTRTPLPTSVENGHEDTPDVFEDVTKASGIDHSFRSGDEAGEYTILELLGGGVALFDFDGDGLLDVFVNGGGYFDGPDKKQIKGSSGRLYKNLGHWRFQDVTGEVGLGQIDFYNHGCAVADYDCDGWPDLLVTGYGRLALFHNESDGKGGRRFVEVTRAAGLERDHFWSTSAGWADLDGDGYPELYVCQYVNWSFANHPLCGGYTAGVARDICPPRQFSAVAHALYQNLPGSAPGQRRFVDVSQSAGLRVPPRPDKDYGKGLGVVIVDVNGDGKPDIYVANDTTDNFLYLNTSTAGKLSFRETGMEMGVARDGGGTPTGSMGVDADDYDGSGRPALWVSTYEGELSSLYQNVFKNGRQFFRYATQAAGIAALGQQNVGFGTGFIDYDNDGWPDLVIGNGHVIHHPRGGDKRQRPVLLHNQGDGRFRDVTSRGGQYFRSSHLARGLAIGDLDNDGRADLVISNVNEPVTVLRNVFGDGGSQAHWLGIELADRDHRDLVGARVEVEVGGRRLTHFVKGGGSYMSSPDRRLLFGLGTNQTVDKVTVHWPWDPAPAQSFPGPPADRYWRLERGANQPVSVVRKNDALSRAATSP
jgi:hypothetical protein